MKAIKWIYSQLPYRARTILHRNSCLPSLRNLLLLDHPKEMLLQVNKSIISLDAVLLLLRTWITSSKPCHILKIPRIHSGGLYVDCVSFRPTRLSSNGRSSSNRVVGLEDTMCKRSLLCKVQWRSADGCGVVSAVFTSNLVRVAQPSRTGKQ